MATAGQEVVVVGIVAARVAVGPILLLLHVLFGLGHLGGPVAHFDAAVGVGLALEVCRPLEPLGLRGQPCRFSTLDLLGLTGEPVRCRPVGPLGPLVSCAAGDRSENGVSSPK